MARYFLNVVDRNRMVPDEVGVLCNSQYDARLEAIAAMVELVADGAWTRDAHYGCYIVIAGADRRPIETVQLWQALEVGVA